MIDRYKNMDSFSSEMVNSTLGVWLPFVGDHWRAHFTLGSFEKEDCHRVWRLIKKSFKKQVKLTSLDFSHINTEGFETIRSWE